MAVTVTTDETQFDALWERGERHNIRSSGGTPYVITSDNSSGSKIFVWKGNAQPPTAFNLIDNANAPSVAGKTPHSVSICIRSDDIIDIIVSYFDNAAHGPVHEIRHYQFHTVDAAATPDTWQLNEQIQTLTQSSSAIQKGSSCAIDINDDLHIFYLDQVTNMGTSRGTAFYQNKIGGTWNTRVEIDGQANQIIARRLSMTLAKDSGGIVVPQLVHLDTSNNEVTASLGNALNATSFTVIVIKITGALNHSLSIACDSTRDTTYIAFVDSGTLDLEIEVHDNSLAWTPANFTNTIIDSAANYNRESVSIAVNGTDRFVFAVDNDVDDVVVWINTGSGWNKTVLESTADVYQTVRCKWSTFVNNEGSIQIDYIFEDTTNTQILWNEHILGLALVVVANEFLDIPEDTALVLGLTKVSAEILDIPEAEISHVGLTRVVADILDIPEDTALVRGRIKVNDEILDIPEQSLITRARIFIGNEVLDLVESALAILGIVKADSEVLDIPEDSVTKTEVVIRGNEILDLAEDANNIVGKIKVNPEVLEIPEASLVHRARVFIANEINELVELANSVRALIKFAETVVYESTANDSSTGSTNDPFRVAQRITFPSLTRIKSMITRVAGGTSTTGTVKGVIWKDVTFSSQTVVAISNETVNLVDIPNLTTLKFTFPDYTPENVEYVIGVEFTGHNAQVRGRQSNTDVAPGVLVIFVGFWFNQTGRDLFGKFSLEGEILDLVESALAHRARIQIGNEVNEIPEQSLAHRARVFIGNEINDIVEAANSIVGKIKVNPEQLDLAESSLAHRARIFIGNEINDLVEFANNVVAKIRVNPEQLDIQEQSLAHRARVFIGNEINDIVEAANKIIGLNKIGNEINDLVEFANRVIGLNQVSAEILDIPETTAITRALVRIRNEVNEIPEGSVAHRARVQVEDEVLDIPENSLAHRARVFIAAEINDLVESALAHGAKVFIGTDILDLAESAIAKVRAIVFRVAKLGIAFVRGTLAPGTPRGTDAIAHTRGTDATGTQRGTDAIALNKGTKARLITDNQ